MIIQFRPSLVVRNVLLASCVFVATIIPTQAQELTWKNYTVRGLTLELAQPPVLILDTERAVPEEQRSNIALLEIYNINHKLPGSHSPIGDLICRATGPNVPISSAEEVWVKGILPNLQKGAVDGVVNVQPVDAQIMASIKKGKKRLKDIKGVFISSKRKATGEVAEAYYMIVADGARNWSLMFLADPTWVALPGEDRPDDVLNSQIMRTWRSLEIAEPTEAKK